MKKRVAKLSATMLAAGMIVTSALPAFAGTITTPGTSGTYDVYQIFTGTYNEDGTVSDVKWGANGTGTVGEAVNADILKALEEVGEGSDREKLDVITNYLGSGDAVASGVAADATTDDLAPGYYLVKHNATGNASTNTYLVEVVGDGNVQLKEKVATPGFDKEVEDNDNADPGAVKEDEYSYWGETADHNINEKFQFRLTATLPDDDDIDTYKAYQLTFHDDLSDAVTYDGYPRMKIKDAEGNTLLDSWYDTFDWSRPADSAKGTAGLNFDVSVTLTDVLPDTVTSLKGLVVEVTYDAYLNKNAAINNIDTNRNTAYLEYSNNPEWDGNGTPDTGKTEEDTVFVFTYDIPNKKVAEDGKTALPGAEFKLYMANGETEYTLTWDSSLKAYRPTTEGDTVARVMSSSQTEDGTFRIVGLDAGTYVLKETKAPEGYTEAEDMTIVITADSHGETSATSAQTTVIKTVNGENFTTNTIVNEKPSNLPTTGGAGTVVFYALGSVMAIGAGTALIAQKRISRKK